MELMALWLSSVDVEVTLRAIEYVKLVVCGLFEKVWGPASVLMVMVVLVMLMPRLVLKLSALAQLA